MINQIDIENFIEGQYRKYFQYTPFAERDQQYVSFSFSVEDAAKKLKDALFRVFK
ncbi:MAG: hypothetical protein IKN04_22790 [Clostridia bacterium]|nr:hypothetical protein [Clostridia bacterium]MBR6186130.1 hypothetical protein [Clostridia bacterium]